MAAVGSGDYRFELIEGWGEVPAGWAIGQAGIVTDSSDRVYMFNRSEHPVVVFDRNGKFLGSWGEGRYKSAHHLAIDHNDRLYLPVWKSHIVVQCDLEGRELHTFGTPERPSNPTFSGDYWSALRKLAVTVDQPYGPFTLPTDVAVAKDGSVYITDGYGNGQVHRFDAQGRLLTSWGRPGSGPGEFRIPHSVKLLSDGRVLIADRENDRIQVFDANGRYLDEWKGFNHPTHLFVDARDTVFVAEGTGFSGRPIAGAFMQLRDADGRELMRWSGPTESPGHFVWMDSRGDLYVGQNREGQRFLKYRRV